METLKVKYDYLESYLNLKVNQIMSAINWLLTDKSNSGLYRKIASTG